MEAIRAILIRHDDHSNFVNSFLCLLMALALSTVALGVANLEIEFRSSPSGVYPEKAPTTPSPHRWG